MADSCRIFIDPSIHVERAKLVQKGYQVFDLKGEPGKILSEVYDLALIPSALHNTAVWMTITKGLTAEVGVAPDGDVRYIPPCTARENLAKVGFFRVRVGGVARNRLDQYYLNHKSPTGMAAMIFFAETVQNLGPEGFLTEYQRLNTKYSVLLDVVKRDWRNTKTFPIYDRLDRIRKTLWPFVGTRLSDESQLSAVGYDHPGSGSLFLTKLFLSVLIDAQIDPGPGRAFGIQLYDDYMQPVVFESSTGKIYDLVSGTEQESDAPVFSPELLTYALANSAGRALSWERDLYLKLNDMKLSSINIALGVKALFGIENKAKDWTQLNQFFGESLSHVETDNVHDSYYALGTKLAKSTGSAAEAFSVSGTGQMPPGMAAAGAGGGSRHIFNATKRKVVDDKVTEDIAKDLAQKYWYAIPEAERPPADEQLALVQSAIMPNTDTQKTDYDHIIRAIPYIRVALPEELKLIDQDLDFGLVKRSDYVADAVVESHGLKIQVFNSHYDVIVRGAEVIERLTGNYFDPIDFPETIPQSFNALIANQAKILQAPQLKEWIENPESLSNADVDPILREVNRLSALRLLAVESYSTTVYGLNAEPGQSELCDLEARSAVTTMDISDHAAEWLSRLDKEPIFKRMQFFKQEAKLQKALSDLFTYSGCKDERKRIKDFVDNRILPIDVLLNYLVAQTADQKQYDLRGQTVVLQSFSDVVFVEPGQENTDKTPVAQSFGNVKSVPTDEKAKFPVSTETFAGILMSASIQHLYNPAVMLLAESVWNERLSAHLREFWSHGEDYDRRLIALWNWPKIIHVSFLPDYLKSRMSQVLGSDGLFAKVRGLRFGDARIPKYMFEDIAQSLKSIGAGAVEWKISVPPVKLEEIHKDVNADFTSCVYFSTLQNAQPFRARSTYTDGKQLLTRVTTNWFIKPAQCPLAGSGGELEYYAGLVVDPGMNAFTFTAGYMTNLDDDKVYLSETPLTLEEILKED